VKTDSGSGVVRDKLKPRLKSGDKLLVTSLGSDWGTLGLSSEVTDWMKKNI
jgi:hypothetical protein